MEREGAEWVGLMAGLRHVQLPLGLLKGKQSAISDSGWSNYGGMNVWQLGRHGVPV